jgi:hypothetical protein
VQRSDGSRPVVPLFHQQSQKAVIEVPFNRGARILHVELTLDRSCRKLTDQGLAILRHLPKLEYLDLSDSVTFTDEALTCLRVLTQLEVLNLNNIEKLTNQGLHHVSRMIYLRELDLGGCRALNDTAMTSLQHLTALTKLGLAGINRYHSSLCVTCHSLTRGQDSKQRLGMFAQIDQH